MSEINEQIQKHNELIKANIYNSFEKGGEGSKGGKIIGHTRSGKPIYDSFEHKEHKNFNSKDHNDAANLHKKLYGEHARLSHTKEKDKNTKIAINHANQFQKHLKNSSDEEVKEKPKEKEVDKKEPEYPSKKIGKTKSGKTIYDFADHPKHKDFTNEDHRDAYNLHKKKAEHHESKIEYEDEGKDYKHEEKRDEHNDQAEEHLMKIDN